MTSHRIALLLLAPLALASCDPATPAPAASPAAIAPRVVPSAAPPRAQEVMTTRTIFVAHLPPTLESHAKSAPAPIAPTALQNADSVMNERFFPIARACYQRGLHDDPHQAGRIVVGFEVAPGGSVLSATPLIAAGFLETTTACIVAKGAELAFESNGLGNGTIIIVPMNFISDGGPLRTSWLTKATDLVASNAYDCIKSRTDECVGNMTLIVHVDASGVATGVHAEHGATVSTPISTCVAEQVAKARFDTGMEATLSMPIVFRPPTPLPANDVH